MGLLELLVLELLVLEPMSMLMVVVSRLVIATQKLLVKIVNEIQNRVGLQSFGSLVRIQKVVHSTKSSDAEKCGSKGGCCTSKGGRLLHSKFLLVHNLACSDRLDRSEVIVNILGGNIKKCAEQYKLSFGNLDLGGRHDPLDILITSWNSQTSLKQTIVK